MEINKKRTIYCAMYQGEKYSKQGSVITVTVLIKKKKVKKARQRDSSFAGRKM